MPLLNIYPAKGGGLLGSPCQFPICLLPHEQELVMRVPFYEEGSSGGRHPVTRLDDDCRRQEAPHRRQSVPGARQRGRMDYSTATESTPFRGAENSRVPVVPEKEPVAVVTERFI